MDKVEWDLLLSLYCIVFLLYIYGDIINIIVYENGIFDKNI